ncbi:MAG TPA: glycosyltransferase family 4 protein [Solirubrobacteraceae bacterium]|jgi:glycosyltransferase involved in cell wall biosynthesis|nr:glycosyltransferase family 4 protein [Solirubrobacteraceae bacterium]
MATRRILFLAPRYPLPADRGDKVRVLHLLDELARRAEVTLVTFGDGDELPFPGVRVRSVSASPLSRLAANLAAPDPMLPGQVRMFLDAGMRSAVREELRSKPDVIHVTLSRLAPYLPHARSPSGPHRHLDLIDSLSLNMRTRADHESQPTRAAMLVEARLMERYEARAVAAADTASVVSEADRLAGEGLRSAAVVPNGVSLERFSWSDPSSRPPVLIFFGNLGYFHNVEPAVFVAREVLPLVRAQRPDASLRIVGARPTSAVRGLGDLDGVEVVGPVGDIARELHGAAAAVLPMFSGSGIKNKVLESFAAGTPVVANALGIQGVEGAAGGVTHLEAEGADGLAAAALDVIGHGAAAADRARSARRLVAEHYSWAAQAQRLLDLYGATAR